MFRAVFTTYRGPSAREYASQWFDSVEEAAEFVSTYGDVLHFRRIEDENGETV